MIIGIDGNEANVRERVGVSWYVFHILHQLALQANEQRKLRIFLREPPRDDLPKASAQVEYCVVSGARLWSQLFLPIHLYLFHSDLSVFIAPAHYAPRFSPCPTITIIHDVSYRYYPHDFRKKDLYQLNTWTRYSVKNASKIVAVSQKTKEDVVAQYHVSSDSVRVIHNGFEAPSVAVPHEKDKTLIYIGTLQPRKNIETLLEAYALFRRTHADYRLVIVGKKGWLYERIDEAIERYHLRDAVTFAGYVDEQEKYQLLGRAQVLIMPAYYEGFGLPLLEAMWTGTPIIAARTGSLPEVGGDACVYVDPIDAYGMSQAMTTLIDDPSRQKKYREAGKKRVKQFTWKHTADQLIALCEEVV
ncbi:MAG: glycosyltransferase family 4 protein [Candidatus Roizmanbacteria bacterium]|nr:glycosyltransferase family 4 protein [Candidatus Roizmanbacteria bacterium]